VKERRAADAKAVLVAPPDLAFHGQPIRADDALGLQLAELLRDDAFDELTVVVAWARFRGLWRLREELEAFKGRGASTILLGIDEDGATRPGLLLAIELFSRAFVFHDERPGTFHPKLYLARGASAARLLVGSGNLTPGGLFSNVEASLDARFDLATEREHPALAGAEAFVRALLDERDAWSRLTPGLVDELVATQRYGVAGVERGRAGGAPGGAGPADAGVEGDAAGGRRLFGAASFAAAALPPIDDAGRARQAELEVEDGPGAAATGGGGTAGGGGPGAPPTVLATWSKTLSRADAQQPKDAARTNPTGVLRLAKAGNPIDWRTYFRRVLFGPATWTTGVDRRGNPIETARVPFAVVVGGSSLGVVTLRVDHAPHREAGQSNVPTILHWGDTLGSRLRSTPMQGHVVTLARLSDGTYGLTIA
jgi:hypothetical protein